jgi:2-succinyl-5-enolpyruvyl-6-hydroxy-3-cyclohexene-1-carboxylate synthase
MMKYTALDAMVSLLVRQGITTACIGAGARSTAILQALQPYNVTIHPFLDERAVGFMALGLTKATRAPVMVITTSGSAVSNLVPAVTEASYDGHPLVVCTADRPKDLQGTSANQTIDQRGIFNHVLAEVSLDCPNDGGVMADIEMALVTQREKGGVIHINIPLPDPVQMPYSSCSASIEWPSSYAPKPSVRLTGASPRPELVNQAISRARNGVLCIGKSGSWVTPSEVHAWVETLGWPTIVDGTHHSLKSMPHVAHCADDAADNLMAHDYDMILYLGGAWISKKMTQYLTLNASVVIHVSDGELPVMPLSDRSYRGGYQAIPQGMPSPTAVERVSAVNRRTEQRMRETLDTTPEMALVHRVLTHRYSSGMDLFVANSLPIRYVDQWPLTSIRQLHCNRGASGIDGNIATIMGLSLIASDGPLLAIVGDLTALYDLNAFMLMSCVQRPLSIIILNNGGGGIFDRLPIAHVYDQFEAHIKLSHNRKLTPILRAMGINATQITGNAVPQLTFDHQVIEYCSTP